MFRKLMFAILILFVYVLQVTVFSTLSLGGITPNLMIILTVLFALLRGDMAGLIVGFFCGLLNDVFWGDVLGFYAMTLMYIGFLAGKFNRIYYAEDIKLPVAIVSVSTLTYGIVCYIILFLMRGRLEFGYYFTKIILPEMLYTVVITILIYPFILLVGKKFNVKGRRRRRRVVR